MFILFGFASYALSSVQGSLQGVRFANEYLHFSQWPVGHAHLALLGGFGFIAAGLALWIVPHVFKSRIYSKNLLKLSWWTASVGFVLFFLAMTIAGLIANANWWEHINVIRNAARAAHPIHRACRDWGDRCHRGVYGGHQCPRDVPARA